jgi:hypothetical protein
MAEPGQGHHPVGKSQNSLTMHRSINLLGLHT